MRLNDFLNFPMMTLAAAMVAAPEAAAADSAGVDLRSTGYLMIDGGYISETEDVGLQTWRNEPFGSFTGGLRLEARPSPNFRLAINPELKSRNIFPISPGITQGQAAQRTRYEIYLEEAKGAWTFGNPDKPRAGLEFGYLIYVDNPDTKVLGNYLFRSMIYPSILFTKMDNTAAYLFGLHAAADFLDGRLKNHAFVLSEAQHYPYFDIHLAYSGSYSFGNFLEVGAGVKANAILPVRPSRTTPTGGEGLGLQDNTYKFVPVQTGTVIRNAAGAPVKTISVALIPGTDSALVTVRDSAGNDEPIRVKATGNGIAGLSRGPLGNSAMSSLTPANGSGDLYPELGGTNTHYSFAGTVLGGRIALNPMAFFGESNPLGKDAFKIYAEVAVLGLKNYDGLYEKRSERLPVMVGLNLPTMGKLDFLTIEVEQFKSREIPTYDKRSFYNIPQPGNHKEEVETLWDDERRKQDDLKWVLAAKRSFRGWGVAAQVGTDHTKLEDATDGALFDVMSKPSQWYAEVRFIAGIR